MLLVAIAVAVAELMVLILLSLSSLISIVIHNDASSLLVAVDACCRAGGMVLSARHRPQRRCNRLLQALRISKLVVGQRWWLRMVTTGCGRW